MDMMQCQNLSVPMDVMQHVVQVESSANPYAIGVVGGRLVRQPQNLAEAVATAEMLESRGYNFSVGLAQVNRYNLNKYGIGSYARAFDGCANLQAGSRILSDCHARAKGDWGSAFSCYYSGNFTTGFAHGYVQKIFSSMAGQGAARADSVAIPLSNRLPQSIDPADGALAKRERRSGDQVASVAKLAEPPSRLVSGQAQRAMRVPDDPSAVVSQASIVALNATSKQQAGPVAPIASQEVNDAAGGLNEQEASDNAFVF